MDDSVFQQPSDDQLHAFTQGDPVIIDEVIRLVLPQIYRWAQRQYANLPDDEVRSTTHQIFAEICINHSRYDPRRAKFTTYVINLLKMRLAGLYRSLRKIREMDDASEQAHENQSRDAYNQVDPEELHLRISREQYFSAVRVRLEGAEREFFELMLQGEKNQEVFASVLARYGSFKDLPAEVKNMKERLGRKMKAVAQELKYEADDLLEG